MTIGKMRKWFIKRQRFFMGSIAAVFGITCFYGLGSYYTGQNVSSGPQFLMAKVNREKITKEQFFTIYNRYMDFYQQKVPAFLRGNYQERLKIQVFDEMVNDMLKMEEAKDLRIRAGRAQIEKKIDQTIDNLIAEEKAGFPSEKEYLDVLKKSGLSIEKRKAELHGQFSKNKDWARDAVILENVEKEIKDKASVTDEDVKKEYEKAKLRHIYFQLPIPIGSTDEQKKQYLEKQREAIKKEAEALLSQLKAGSDFATAAKARSNFEYSRNAGGDLGLVTRAQLKQMGLEEEFIEAAFALKQGELSGVVDVKSGLHIIKCEEKKEARGKDFEKEKKKIKENLLSQRQNDAYSKWFEEVKKKAKIEILDPQIRAAKALNEQKWEKAIADYALAIKENDSDPYLYASRAKAYEGKNDLKLAIKDYEKALSFLSADYELHLSLGYAYEKAKKMDLAYKAFKQASTYAPKEEPWPHYNIQAAFQRLNKKQDADKEQKLIDELTKKQQSQQLTTSIGGTEVISPANIQPEKKKPGKKTR